MPDWSLARVLENLHSDIQNRLSIARSSFAHPGTKGDASESIWIEVFQKYLPQRYQAEKAHVVDSKGVFSQQIDVVVFDHQYSPFIFNFQGQLIVPAESVYAVFEAKQSVDATMIRYAQEKVASVRKLRRTSLPIPHAGGTYSAKPLIPILGGILTFESDWNPPLGEPLSNALAVDQGDGRLDLGCVASHGHFHLEGAANQYTFKTENMPATAFLFKLIAQLQFSGTVPMIDIEAYGLWLTPGAEKLAAQQAR